jgi:hypothetical protein
MTPTTLLRWTLAAVLGIQAALLVAARPPPPLIALGAAELTAAIVFVLPWRAAVRAGAIGLVAVLALAAAIHLHLGERPPPAFAVYVAAIWVVAREASVARRAS